MADQTDANFFSSFFQQPAAEEVVSSKIQICAKYGDFYNLSHPNRGIALIFNHEVFDGKLTREGSNLDRDRLRKVLTDLEFEVRVFQDLKFSEIYNIIKKVAQEDHTHNDCFLVCVMSHGDEGKIYAKDHSYPPDILWDPVTGENCQTLAGKPKLFFIQACRGNLVDEGTKVRTREQTDSAASMGDTYTIPAMADILVMYSTYMGYYSWRSPSSGSWFMQSLCKELEANAEESELMSLLTRVNRRVAIDFWSNVPDTPNMHKKKQICTIVSMLTRLMAFPVKKPRSARNNSGNSRLQSTSKLRYSDTDENVFTEN